MPAGAFQDSRLELVIGDAADFLQHTQKKFDVIISDCTDPIGPGADLFSLDFYAGCQRCLNQNEDGIFVAQNGVYFLQQDEVLSTYRSLRQYFKDVSFYQAAIPTYQGGNMTFAWACATIWLCVSASQKH